MKWLIFMLFFVGLLSASILCPTCHKKHLDLNRNYTNMNTIVYPRRHKKPLLVEYTNVQKQAYQIRIDEMMDMLLGVRRLKYGSLQ